MEFGEIETYYYLVIFCGIRALKLYFGVSVKLLIHYNNDNNNIFKRCNNYVYVLFLSQDFILKRSFVTYKKYSSLLKFAVNLEVVHRVEQEENSSIKTSYSEIVRSGCWHCAQEDLLVLFNLEKNANLLKTYSNIFQNPSLWIEKIVRDDFLIFF